MRLDGHHEQADARPLPHGELVQLYCGAPQARVGHPGFPADAFPEFEVFDLMILRDPYNNWASRVAANDRVKTGGKG